MKTESKNKRDEHREFRDNKVKKEVCDCANNLIYLSATTGFCMICGRSVDLLAN